MKLQYTSPSGIMVSTIKIPYTKGYETMIFNKNGTAIFERRYTNKTDALKYHNYYVDVNPK